MNHFGIFISPRERDEEGLWAIVSILSETLLRKNKPRERNIALLIVIKFFMLNPRGGELRH